MHEVALFLHQSVLSYSAFSSLPSPNDWTCQALDLPGPLPSVLCPSLLPGEAPPVQQCGHAYWPVACDSEDLNHTNS